MLRTWSVLTIWKEVAFLISTVAIGLSGKCYIESNCEGTGFDSSGARECCVNDGTSYSTDGINCTIFQCIVHGFNNTNISVKEGDRLQVSFGINVKGETRFPNLQLDGEILLVDTSNNTLWRGSTNIPIAYSPPVDNVTLELNHTVRLLFSPDNHTIQSVVEEAGEFIRNTAEISIIDVDTLSVLRPGWFPFQLSARDKIVFPDNPIITENIILNEFDRLILSCRFDEQPKAAIEWRFNDHSVNNPFALPQGSFEIFDEVAGKSALILDLANSFNETQFTNELLGYNVIDCVVPGPYIMKRVMVVGSIIECTFGISSQPCSTTCGFGTRPRSAICDKFIATQLSTPIDIDDVPQSVVPAIARTEPCATVLGSMGHIILCPHQLKWVTSNWTMCSKTCGGGVQNRTISCSNVEFNASTEFEIELMNSIPVVVEDIMCAMSDAAGLRPAESQLCNEQQCPFFQVGLFGPCSATCGDSGVRTRSVECVELIGKYIDTNGNTRLNVSAVNNSMCGSIIPEKVAECNRFPCFQWQPGTFGPCGEISLITGPVADEFSCKEREIHCINESGSTVNDLFCEAAQLVKPSALSRCGGGNCYVGIWNINTQYSACSAKCGYGIQTRKPICYSPRSLTPIPDVFCHPATKPPTMRNCFDRNCPNMCLRDESPVCPIMANFNICDLPFAMGSNGLRCCVSCGTGAGGD